MPWLQLKFEVPANEAELLAELMEEAGAASVALEDAADQPLFEPPPGATPLWNKTWVVGLFTADTDMDVVLQQMQQAHTSGLPPHQLNPLEDKDWVRAWLDDFKPMRFGERLWIVPSSYDPPDPQAVNILLDPGLAFGTGTHPTTAMCLHWLDAHPPINKIVVDYGCGSGILAIAACKLGASSVLCVDTDPQALLATESNARNNGVADKIHTYLPDDTPDQYADLLIANILAGPLHALASTFAQRVQPGGHIVLSGILDNQAEALIQSYQSGFDITRYRQQDEWICLHGVRQS